jgi:hypothetical protein
MRGRSTGFKLIVPLAVLAVLSGCGKHGSQSSGASSDASGEDEATALAAPQFTAPIMLHLTGDAYQQAQQLKALNGVDPRNTNGAAYEKADFFPCSTDQRQVLDNLNPGISIPVERVALINALFTRNIYHFETYTIQYPNASSPGYGTSNTFFCAVMTEGTIQPPPGQPSSWVHQPINVQFGQRVFQAWTYRNRYTTPSPGHGDAQVFAGTFTYAIREDIPLGPFQSFGTGNVKVSLNPDTGRWEIASLVLNDPQLMP